MPRTGRNGNQPVRAAKGQVYGERKRQEEAQQVIPLPQQAAPTAPRREVPPGSLIPLTAPTQLPEEPVTAGLPLGEGPGPEALAAQPMGDGMDLAQLKAVYRRFPSEDLRRLIERAERGAYT